MKTPPSLIDGATVLRVADLSRTRRTGRTRHVVRGQEVTEFAALAIAQYEDAPGFYLFYCDDDWTVITDTYHESVEAAVAQARFEFDSVVFADLSDGSRQE